MRDAQKGRKSWLERLTSPPEADDEQPPAGERSPFDQPGPFDQGPFDQAPFDQSGPFDPPGEQNRGIADGFDAFAPPALRKSSDDDSGNDDKDGSASMERPAGKPGPVKSFDGKGFDRNDEGSSSAPGQSSSGPAREPWEVPVPGLGVPRSSQASSSGPPSGPTPTAAPASGPTATGPGSGPVISVSGATGTPAGTKDSGPIPLPKPGGSPATPAAKSADSPGSSGSGIGSGIRDRSDDEPSFGASPWRSDSDDTGDVPGIGGRGSDRGSGSEQKLSDEVVPMPSGPSEDEQREAARRRHIEELQHRWLVTQAQLLDDPRDAVREAGLLIGDAMQFVTSTFTEHRDRIEREWKRESELSTDELRIVMRRYRNLFQYVLSASQLPDI